MAWSLSSCLLLQRLLFLNKVWAAPLCSEGSCCCVLMSFLLSRNRECPRAANAAIPARVYLAGLQLRLQGVICSSLCCHRVGANSMTYFYGRVVSFHLATFLFARLLFFISYWPSFPKTSDFFFLIIFFFNQRLLKGKIWSSPLNYWVYILIQRHIIGKKLLYCWLRKSYLGNTWSHIVTSVCPVFNHCHLLHPLSCKLFSFNMVPSSVNVMPKPLKFGLWSRYSNRIKISSVFTEEVRQVYVG